MKYFPMQVNVIFMTEKDWKLLKEIRMAEEDAVEARLILMDSIFISQMPMKFSRIFSALLQFLT